MQRALEGNAWLYDGVFVLLIVFFTYFYTTLTFRADDVADNIKKQGGYIPGIRPGRQTAEYIRSVLYRITLGAPSTSRSSASSPPSSPTRPSEGCRSSSAEPRCSSWWASLDTVQQIEGHLISRNYEGFAGARGPRSAVDCGRPHEG